MPRQSIYILCVALAVALGVASRVFNTGLVLIDKYLGDALYAILVYLLLSLVWAGAPAWKKAALACAIMLAIEAFQLTLVPERLARSGDTFLELLAVALGTKWSWRDLVAYAAGIVCFALADRHMIRGRIGRAKPASETSPTT
jgi:hypothetical protein